MLDKLVITVTNATGASTAVLEGFTLSVRCKVGALKLIGDTSSATREMTNSRTPCRPR